MSAGTRKKLLNYQKMLEDGVRNHYITNNRLMAITQKKDTPKKKEIKSKNQKDNFFWVKRGRREKIQ